ncbi:MAG TPA: phage tail protein [Pyrinomonadaceae bacterium]
MPTETTHTPGGGLLQYLPAIFAEDPFLGQFLLAFEKILLGRDDAPVNAKLGTEQNPRGLEQIIDGLAALYDPSETPVEFLPWLAKWAALSLRADMSLEQQRRFVAQVIPLYQKRGTQENLRKLLALYLTAVPTVEVDKEKPYFFQVTITLPPMEWAVTQRQFEIAQALVELEKPAHTNYRLRLDTPSLQIRKRSQVGVNTLLGTAGAKTTPDEPK